MRSISNESIADLTVFFRSWLQVGGMAHSKQRKANNHGWKSAGLTTLDSGTSTTQSLPSMITAEIAESIDQSVLCWFATISGDGFPNVSPKEAFLHDGEGGILVANIASPVTVRNIERDPRVCVSFVNVFVQKGYKIAGRATVLKTGDAGFDEKADKLTAAIGPAFPVISVIVIEPVRVDEIVAPSYRLFPDSGPLDRIRESLQTYRVDEYKQQADNDPC